MGKKLRRLGLIALLVVVPLSAVIWIALLESEVGMARDITAEGTEPYDVASLPAEVIEDALARAAELVGMSRDRLEEAAEQLLALYVQASNSDVLIFFNSGGWGWNSLKETPGWNSILDGMRSHLGELGYKSVVVNYVRTSRSWRGCIKEFFEAALGYPQKAKDLAHQVEFLLEHLSDLKVIIAGESSGTVITAKTKDILRDDPRVFSVQTGTPFWFRPSPDQDARTLLMNSNGESIDTFSYGNFPEMIWATVKGWFGVASPRETPGDVLKWLRAPGHHYAWDYPGVASAVREFLEVHFGRRG
ncbi:MAG: hypothetical protein N2506_05940 [Dehalococcoidales bacterium]|nr:hypothetical protein [Dehalococcoidales bacterium]